MLVLLGICSVTSAQSRPELTPLTDVEPAREFRPDRGLAEEEAKPDARVNLNAGVSLVKRSFTLDSTTAGLEFESSFYPAVYVRGDVFPLRNLEGFSGLGVVVDFKRGVDTTVINEGGVTRRVPTRHSELGISLAYRFAVTYPLKLRAETGFKTLDFVLGRNPFYTNTTYRAWRAAVSGSYALSRRVSISSGLELYPVVGLGASEVEFGESSSTFGAGLGAGGTVDLIEALYAQIGYDVSFYNSMFEGVGQRGLENVITTDFYHEFCLWLGYRL